MLSLVSFGLIVIITILVFYYTFVMRKHNYSEYETVKDLKRRIDELDVDNVEVNEGAKEVKIIVPDEVDANESTTVSTQDEECKEYMVKPYEKIEKTVIGSNEAEKDFENIEIERVEDKEDDDPIKEPENIISKILKNNKDEE